MTDYLFEQSRGAISLAEIPPHTVTLNITKSIDNVLATRPFISADVLAAAQRAWRMAQDRAETVEHVMAYYKRGERRLILGYFNVDEKEGWLRSVDNDRMMFLGYPAHNRADYELHELPSLTPGARNPVKYYD